MDKNKIRPVVLIFSIGIVVCSSVAQQPEKLYASISGVVSRNTGMLPVFIPVVGGRVYLENFFDNPP
jgi:hypothetical protein